MTTRIPSWAVPVPNTDAYECKLCGERLWAVRLAQNTEHGCAGRRQRQLLSGQSEEVFYGSPSMGRVRIVAQEGGHGFSTPDALERHLCSLANCGQKVDFLSIAPACFRLLKSCFDVIGSMSRPALSAAEIGLATNRTRIEGLRDQVLAGVSDDKLVDEIAKRGIKSFRDTLTDDKLRAECNRRWGEDDCPMAMTLRAERDVAVSGRDSYKKAIDEVDAVIFKHSKPEAFVRAEWLERVLAGRDGLELVIQRDEWKAKFEYMELKFAKLLAKSAGEHMVPHDVYPPPKIGEIVEAIAAAEDAEAACDIIDQQVFQERLGDVLDLRGGRKLAADIRGVIVAACRELRDLKLCAPVVVHVDRLPVMRLEPGVIMAAPRLDTPEKFASVLATGRIDECGPGIAAKPAPRPDHSVWFLAEDLLADDE